jgi:hypothetical protein
MRGPARGRSRSNGGFDDHSNHGSVFFASANECIVLKSLCARGNIVDGGGERRAHPILCATFWHAKLTSTPTYLATSRDSQICQIRARSDRIIPVPHTDVHTSTDIRLVCSRTQDVFLPPTFDGEAPSAATTNYTISPSDIGILQFRLMNELTRNLLSTRLTKGKKASSSKENVRTVEKPEPALCNTRMLDFPEPFTFITITHGYL